MKKDISRDYDPLNEIVTLLYCPRTENILDFRTEIFIQFAMITTVVQYSHQDSYFSKSDLLEQCVQINREDFILIISCIIWNISNIARPPSVHIPT